jgi:hypothetical protein
VVHNNIEIKDQDVGLDAPSEERVVRVQKGIVNVGLRTHGED